MGYLAIQYAVCDDVCKSGVPVSIEIWLNIIQAESSVKIYVKASDLM